MKSKKILIVSILVIIIFGVLAASSSVLAVKDPGSWNPVSLSDTSKMEDLVGKIISFVQIIGSAIAVIMIIVLGIKYMVGSAEEKAEYKKTLLPYVIGAICIFAASNIASMVYKFIV